MATIDISPESRTTLLALLQQFLPDVTVWAFGSRVKGTTRRTSDLDLVVFSHPEQEAQVSRLKEALEESSLPFRVDLLVWDNIPASFQQNIQACYAVLVEGQAPLAWKQSSEQEQKGMSSEWPEFPLEECLDALIDYRGKTPTKTESGIPLVTAKVIKGGRIETPTEFIDPEEYDSWMRRGIPAAGDVVMTTEAPLGEVAQLGCEKVALAQRVITLRGKEGFLDNTYLLYLFLTEEMQDQLKARATGTTVLGIKQSELRKITLKVPPLIVQQSAARALKNLDDRIALLRETNATLEAIAQALFKSWFVDFDPVHSKARGEAPHGMDDTTAALLPDSFEESELGMIPKGWKVGELQDLLVLQRGFDLPASKRIDGEFPLIAASGPSGTHNIAMARAPGIVTGRSGVLGKVFLVLEDYWPLNTTLWVKEFKRATPCYAYEIMRRLDFASFNAGSAVPTLNRNHVHGLKYLLPPSDLIQAFESIAILQHQRAFANSKQAQTLAQLRDTLLPKLISGQLRLPEAEALLAEELP